MSDYEAHVDDIALFFALNARESTERWVPHSVYADPEFLVENPIPPQWKGSVFSQQPCAGGAPDDYWYLVNLSLLLEPGVSVESQTQRKAAVHAATGREKKTNVTPKKGDLVVVPWDAPDQAFLVPRTRYEDEEVCPPLKSPSVSDLVYAAIDEGVVLANLPRPASLVGATCYLLSLLSLKSGALEPKDDKRGGTDRLRDSRKHHHK
jgi:hypothetical protein